MHWHEFWIKSRIFSWSVLSYQLGRLPMYVNCWDWIFVRDLWTFLIRCRIISVRNKNKERFERRRAIKVHQDLAFFVTSGLDRRRKAFGAKPMVIGEHLNEDFTLFCQTVRYRYYCWCFQQHLNQLMRCCFIVSWKEWFLPQGDSEIVIHYCSQYRQWTTNANREGCVTR